MLTVEELVATIRAKSEEEDRLGPGPKVVASIVEAGFARHFVPREFGGAEGTFSELTGAVATVGAASPSTAWCASLFAGLGRMIAYLPTEGYSEIWRDGTDPLVVGALVAFGEAVEAEGGWMLSGHWPYISGVERADWVLLGAEDREGKVRVFALRRSQVTVEDTWDSIGLRATGSHNVVVDGVHVHKAFTFARDDLLAGRPTASAAACHTVPLEAANLLFFVLPLLGTAEGALSVWADYAAGKAAAWNPSVPSASELATTFARTSGEIEAARLLLERCAAVCDRGSEVTEEDVARNTRDTSLAAEILVSAVNRLMARAGTSNYGAGRVLQRFWRDANTMSSHVALRFEMAAMGYAEGRLWEPGKAPGLAQADASW